ncbi:MAG: dihydrolipoamide acetyltransferase family protein [Bacteroidales bacterium]|jgi:pyruvate dehydrogenase E2 component (dihydrolipoamide acetyltransferase)|nr:dihydrolipoamide acetyltransferase family protein [Bacteroidales bacterium]
MAIPVIMPKQGQSVETCIITRWYVKQGDPVAKGDILLSYETDKAAFDLESPADGVLLDIFCPEGSEVPVLTNIAVIGSAGEDTAGFSPGGAERNAENPPPVLSVEDQKYSRADSELLPQGIQTQSRIRISPRAKKLAAEKELDYSSVKGSGPNGRIILRDIEATLAYGAVSHATVSSEEGFTERPLSNVRKLIAGAMHSSLQNSAQLTHHLSADARKILEARVKIKESLNNNTANQDITLNDMICFCVVRALRKHPEANSHFLADRIRIFNSVNLGIAVDTDRGLMVPVVKNADSMDIEKLSLELKSMVAACRKGNISPELLQSTSASFTVSNLGNYGVEMFTPVINLPQTAILGVCTIIYRPADMGNNVMGLVPFIGLSLTYDHRAIDGGPATLFLRDIKREIEKFIYK